jgi:hypothetical protein
MIVLEILEKPDNRFKKSGLLKPAKWKVPFISRMKKGKPKILHFEGAHVTNIIEAFKKMRLRALEKE